MACIILMVTYSEVYPRTYKKSVQLPAGIAEQLHQPVVTNISDCYESFLIRGSLFPAYEYPGYLRSSARCRERIQPAPIIKRPNTMNVQLSGVFSDRKLAAESTPTLSP